MTSSLDLEVQLPRSGATAWFNRDSPAAMVTAERQIVLCRWLGTVLAAVVGPLLFRGTQLLLLEGVCLTAAAYSLFFQLYVIPRRPQWLLNGYITSIGDNLLAAAIIYFTGGLASEFFLVYFLIAVLSAVRVGGRRVLVSIGAAAASYVVIVLLAGAPPTAHTFATVAFRIGFAAVTAIFVGFVGDRARAAERQVEAAAVQARQALSEATAALTSSLRLDDMLGIAARWAAMLAGALRAEIEVGPPQDLAQYLAGVDDRQRRHATHGVAAGPEGPVEEHPVAYGGQSIGVLRVVLAAGPPPDEMRRSLVRTFAERCGPAISNAWTYMAMQSQALLDPTTGLANHRRFKEYLSDREREAERLQRPLSVLMLDLDMFKEFNDTFGHLAGDRALRRVGHILAAAVGNQGLAARYGGDEFVAVLPGLDGPTAAAVAAAVLDGFREARSTRRDGLQPPVGLSIGVATASAGEADYQTLVGRADLAMYLAKRSGGGVRVFADIDESEPLRTLVGSIMTQLNKTDLLALGGRPRLSAGSRGRRAGGPARTIEVVRTLLVALRIKDPALMLHSRNVARLCFRMGRRLGLSPWETYDVGLAGLLHDIGKICVPDRILHKPAALDAAEMAVIRLHAVQGGEILAPVPSLANVARMVHHHHEHFDGSGYPDGLAADAIPLASRIILVADAYDAMTADRPYRRGRSPDEAVHTLRDCQGTQFDPRVVVTLTTLLTDLRTADRARERPSRGPKALEVVGA